MTCTDCKQNVSCWIETKDHIPYCYDCFEIRTDPTDLRHYAVETKA